MIHFRKESTGVLSACGSELLGKFGRLPSPKENPQEFRHDDLDDDDDDNDDVDNFYWMFSM